METGTWLLFLLALILFVVGAVNSFGKADPRICHWQTCSILEDTAAACGPPGKGQFQDAVEIFRKLEGRGVVFVSECTQPIEGPALTWEKPVTVFRSK